MAAFDMIRTKARLIFYWVILSSKPVYCLAIGTINLEFAQL